LGGGSPLLDSKKKAIKAASVATGKKAKDIRILELKDISTITDYFIICSVLLDFGDVVVHIFDQESRDYYELEKLWLDAPRISFEETL
jgi:ribosome-associated protein